MLVSKSMPVSILSKMAYKAKAFFELVKLRLSVLVVFSAAMGYLIASTTVDWVVFTWFSLGAFLVTAAANTINQIIEVESDKLMKRTQQRPIPTGRVTRIEALLFALIMSITGLCILYHFTNALTTWLSFTSLALYCFFYTPMKKLSPWAVFVGAFPGAAPPLLGWVAATDAISVYAIVLFGIQFIWQFPHFWSIAWVLDEDYRSAGFKLLPSSGGKNFFSAFQIMLYTLFLVPLSLLPLRVGMGGVVSAIILGVSAILFVVPTVSLMKDFSKKSALRIMFASFLYLPIVLVALYIDRSY
jgi:protoheme IX farnesyltransferase